MMLSSGTNMGDAAIEDEECDGTAFCLLVPLKSGSGSAASLFESGAIATSFDEELELAFVAVPSVLFMNR